MISKIDIAKFGLFRDYTWNNNIGGGQDDTFKRVNVLYGRNYSGKTTLSRILRCIEKKELHEFNQEAQFTVHLKSSHQIAHTDLNAHSDELQVRVYNSDFVKDNLSWLHNSDGTIKPFTILGAKNVDLDKKIKEVEEKLGSVESQKGALHDLAEQAKQFDAKKKSHDQKRSDLDNKLRSKALQIKTATNLYNVPTYNIASIRSDIPRAKEKGILDDGAIEERKKTLRDDPKPNIARISTRLPDFAKLIEKSKNAMSKKITPSQPIKELVDDHLLQDWVRNGIEKHRNKKTACAFCGSPLPKELWQKLDAHFNKESEDLRREITDVQTELKAVQRDITQLVQTNRNSFYNTLQASFDDAISDWNTELKLYISNVEKLFKGLQARIDDIFHEVTLEDIKDNTDGLGKKLVRINELIDHNNQKTTTLSVDQKAAQDELRLSDVAQFIKEVHYETSLKEAGELETETTKCEEKKIEAEKQVKKLAEEKRSLELQLQDESKGAALVNQHLKEFFGHDELKLEPEGAKPNMKFKITRENADAKNLSEGECSLISFCYFIARIEDELKDDLSQNRLIIYIDDPISSLDSNHIFFMFSLIETIIAKPKKYAQLFISTHNLDFFKYIKRLTMPDGKNSVSYFLVERRQKKNDRKSFIIKMPPHLRDYVTEFNYLFNEIYKVYKVVNGDRKQQIENSYNQFYNLPNNLRKFLECYLFFRFPNNGNPLDNLPKLFDNHIPALINRVVHEYSHLTYIDRGWMPMDVGEAEECAKLVIEKLKEKDKDQFEALVASVS